MLKKMILCLFLCIAILTSGASSYRQSAQAKLLKKMKLIQKENGELKRQIAKQVIIIKQLKALLVKNNIRMSPTITKYVLPEVKIASGPLEMGSILIFPNENFVNILNITGSESMTVKFSARKVYFPYSQERWMAMSVQERDRFNKAGTCVVIKGVSTKGLVSDARLDLQGSFKITGTQSALNQFKEQKTLFVMEPIIEK